MKWEVRVKHKSKKKKQRRVVHMHSTYTVSIQTCMSMHPQHMYAQCIHKTNACVTHSIYTTQIHIQAYMHIKEYINCNPYTNTTQIHAHTALTISTSVYMHNRAFLCVPGMHA
jgi:hypothetical protein